MRKPMILVAALALTFSALSLPPASDEAFGQGHMGGHGGPMMGGHRGMMEHGGVSWPDSLQVVTVSGTTIVDTIHYHYYLDEDRDGSADYYLSFGPWWYEPENEATRPQNGDAITVKGGVCATSDTLEAIIVFEINGLKWRDPEELLPWSGGWMHAEAGDTMFVHSTADSLSWMGFPPESMWDMMKRMRSLMMGMMGQTTEGPAADSLYVHFEQVHPEGLPVPADSMMAAAYHVGFTDPCGNELMHDQMMRDFDHEVMMSFHYDEGELERRGLSEESLVLKHMTDEGWWEETSGSRVDATRNTVTVKTKRISSYYGLFAGLLTRTDVEEAVESRVPSSLVLLQNYPNPFNPTTTIRYYLPTDNDVHLEVFDLLGQRVRTLVEGPQTAGHHSVLWDGTDSDGRKASGGIYLYRLDTGDVTAAKKMLMLK